MSTALLIIDVQRALCTGEYECFDIKRVIDTINDLSTKARAADIPVILIQHEEEGDLLQYGSEGWQLAEGLKTSCLLYTSPSPRDGLLSRMPSSA